jgi:hypothetical protein
MKLLVIGLLGFVVFSLVQAMFAMARGATDDSMVWALTRRMGASVLLFLLLMLGWMMGWIHPVAGG